MLLRVHEQVVLRQEAGEQHPVPLRIRHLLDEHGKPTDLTGLSAQGIAERPLLPRESRERPWAVHGQDAEGGARRTFGLTARPEHGFLKLVSQCRVQRSHLRALSSRR